jgi:hypothetical protein
VDYEGESALLVTCTNVDVEQMPSSQAEVDVDELKLFVHLGKGKWRTHVLDPRFWCNKQHDQRAHCIL